MMMMLMLQLRRRPRKGWGWSGQSRSARALERVYWYGYGYARTVLHCTGDGKRSTAAPAIGAGEWALSSVGSVFGSTPLYEVLGCKKSAINSPKTFEVDSAAISASVATKIENESP